MRFVRFAGIREKKVEKSGIFYVKIEKSLGCIRYLAVIRRFALWKQEIILIRVLSSRLVLIVF